MDYRGFRFHIRKVFIQKLLKSLATEESRQLINMFHTDYSDIRRSIPFFKDPYKKSFFETSVVASPVFITGRFRSGSTLLWNIFRNLQGYTSYYEPLNERRWFKMTERKGSVDKTHRGVSEYWSEYIGLDELDSYYHEDWIRHYLYMNENTFDFDMKAYITTLVSCAKGRAVLQFNRADFRLGWLRANYPGAHIVHIYRNPRDQWCSVLRDIQQYPSDATTAQGFPDYFYLQTWARDLCRQFPFLADYQNCHQYYLFYFLWKLSYCFGCHYADISVAMEDLTNHAESTTRLILKAIGEADNIQDDDIDLSFVQPTGTRWTEYATDSWFQVIEEECDKIVEDFLQGAPAS